jgi:hypothetical protein
LNLGFYGVSFSKRTARRGKGDDQPSDPTWMAQIKSTPHEPVLHLSRPTSDRLSGFKIRPVLIALTNLCTPALIFAVALPINGPATVSPPSAEKHGAATQSTVETSPTAPIHGPDDSKSNATDV